MNTFSAILMSAVDFGHGLENDIVRLCTSRKIEVDTVHV